MQTKQMRSPDYYEMDDVLPVEFRDARNIVSDDYHIDSAKVHIYRCGRKPGISILDDLRSALRSLFLSSISMHKSIQALTKVIDTSVTDLSNEDRIELIQEIINERTNRTN